MNAFGYCVPYRLKSMTTWNEKAKLLITSRGLKYRQFAEALEVSESAFGHYLSGRRNARLEQIRIIARELQMFVMELIEDDPYWIVDEDERTLIDSYRSLPKSEAAVIKKLIQNAAKESYSSESSDT